MERRFRTEANDLLDYLAEFLLDSVTFLAGVLIFVAILFAMNWFGGRIRRHFGDRSGPHWKNHANAPFLIDNVLRVVIFGAGLILAMGVVGVRTSSLVTWFGVIIAALSIALQDVIKNLVAGFYLLVEQPFRTGDRLAMADIEGRVERVDLRVTAIRNRRRQLVLIPNYLVFSQVVTNKTAQDVTGAEIRLSGVQVSPKDAEREVLSALGHLTDGEGRPPELTLRSTGPAGLTADLRLWSAPNDLAADALILALADRFPEATIDVFDS